MIVLSIAIGLLLLVVGGDVLVRGSVATAQRLNVSPLLIGLVLVGFGTSTPELVTSINAAMLGSPGIAVGNVVGSNIANILLILGLTALVRPLAVSPAALMRDGVVMSIATGLCAIVFFAGTVTILWGTAFLSILFVYILFTYFNERTSKGASANLHVQEAEFAPSGPHHLGFAFAMIVSGIGVTILGAWLLVSGAVQLAANLGVSESVIGLTMVAVGTSLPELTTSVIAARRGATDVAFGNIIGSNIFNLLGILGATAMLHPIAVPNQIATSDVWVLIGSALLLILFASTGWRLSRLEGACFLVCYFVYVGWQFGLLRYI